VKSAPGSSSANRDHNSAISAPASDGPPSSCATADEARPSGKLSKTTPAPRPTAATLSRKRAPGVAAAGPYVTGIDIDGPDFFTGNALLAEPYAYLAAMRGECPVRREKLPTMDPPVHTQHRGLLTTMITPIRLRENEEFMQRLCARQYDAALVASGSCEFIGEFASPFVMLVIADLLGVPEDDHEEFVQAVLHGAAGDVLSRLAHVTFPDSAVPEVIDVVRVAANLFAAGQETTIRLLSSAVRILAEDRDLQARLRADRNRHLDRRVLPRAAGRPEVQLHPDVHPARPDQAAHRPHAGLTDPRPDRPPRPAMAPLLSANG
jgi:hypothetical protein